MKRKIIEIFWNDVASLNTGLMDIEDLEGLNPPVAVIIGYLVLETKEAYYIAKELWETGQFKYLHVVPKNTAIIKKEIRELDE